MSRSSAAKLGKKSAGLGIDLVEWEGSLAQQIRELEARVAGLGEQFRSAKPFPHIVLDDFLPRWIAESVEREFPGPDSSIWAHLPTEDQRRKMATVDDGQIPPLSRTVLHHLNSGSFLRFLEKMTGISNLVADMKYVGGGLHQNGPGGKLAVHIDYSHHPQNGLYRQLNLLVYLNREWKEDYHGHIELWDPRLTRCEKKVFPAFNRCVIFRTSDISFHGYPEPMSCPEGQFRKNLSTYYFTKEPPAGREQDVHNTLFKSRPGDSFNLGNFLVRSASSGLFRDLIPPVLYRLIRRVWNSKFTGK